MGARLRAADRMSAAACAQDGMGRVGLRVRLTGLEGGGLAAERTFVGGVLDTALGEFQRIGNAQR